MTDCEQNTGERFWDEPDVRGRWETFTSLLAPRPGERILDVGCGRGTPACFMATQVGLDGRVVATDTSSQSLKQARAEANRHVSQSLDLVRSEADRLPFPDATFDVAISVNVLEAVTDKAGFINEIHRVLKPGGRTLIAHDDYESQVYATTDRELGRRVTLAYADSTFASYATSDGRMGRHLWGLFGKSPFVHQRLHVIPLFNTEYRPSLLGWTHAQFTAEFVSRVSDLTQAELDRWRGDLEARSLRGDYLYCVNLYVCLGVK